MHTFTQAKPFFFDPAKPFEILNVSSKDFDKFFVGFDEQFTKLAVQAQDLTRNTQNYPPFNIKKLADNSYVIELAVAGFNQFDIDITVDGNKLTVTGSTIEDDCEFLFKGIANRGFTRSFALADKIEVQSALIDNGMLKIVLDKMVELSTVRKIEVKGSSTKAQFLTEEEKDEISTKL